MENDNKKKKNKKKKNKQAKNAESSTAAAAATVAASVSADQLPNGFDQHNTSQAQHMSHPSADLDRHGVKASNASVEQVKQLEMEKEAYMNKENDLELKFSKLHSEKENWLQKEAILEEKIKQLQRGKEQLQREKEEYIEKEAGYEEKISQLVNEVSTTSSKEFLLKEKIKQLETERESWAQKESSTTETVAGLIADNARIRAQVMELEESQKNLFQENQQLLENISGLQKQIQSSAHLSSEIGEMENQHIKSEMLAAQTMVEKLLLEKAELAEKLNAERDRQGTMAELSSSGVSGPVASTIKLAHNVENSSVISDSTDRILSVPVAESSVLKPDPISGTPAKLEGEVVDDASGESQPLLEEKTMPVESGEVFQEELCSHSNHNNTPTPDTEITISTETEQIPSEDSDTSGTNLSLEDSSSNEKSTVPISDAPLIGAPFRFISFMARYVSGADLVNQSP